ncbi:hypothetical protein LU11_gp298 [Pseudomonas phage Lu11]|uniref:hypothetical protein n=1 Tax=Pseudomonas phage Lu11 TaxID=1161927 RepID=UPI00025F1854|nr:hypothetical protein LU11_gp298 [Pseudomonas phage Lu11]AFH14829.1 hypothetical protein Lu11_0291 [Pseudomonas phage Lu11]
MRQLPLRWYDFLFGRRKYKLLFNELVRVNDNTAVMAAKAKAQESLCQKLSLQLQRVESALKPTLDFYDAEMARKERDKQEKLDRENMGRREPLRAQYPEKQLPVSMGARVESGEVRRRTDRRDDSGDYHINPALIADDPIAVRSTPAPSCSPSRSDSYDTPSRDSGGWGGGGDSGSSGDSGGGGGCD